MDRGIPTEAVLAEMRSSDPPVQYLVGTPKGRLSRLEKDLLTKPWQQARQGVQVKLLAEDSELYVYAESVDRVSKERAMRKRQMKWLWKRLRELAAMEISREEMLMKLGAARSRAPTAWRLIDIEMDKESSMFIYTLNRQKLRKVRRREGRYLLRTNLTENDPALLWQYYIQLVAVEEAFKNLKGDLAIRPVFHQDARRIEAHIFIAFLAYCLQITLQRRLHALAPGLTTRSAVEKFAAVQMIDVHLPTTDGRELLLTRYTQPEPELKLLIQQLKLQLPPQPPPKIAPAAVARAGPPELRRAHGEPGLGQGHGQRPGVGPVPGRPPEPAVQEQHNRRGPGRARPGPPQAGHVVRSRPVAHRLIRRRRRPVQYVVHPPMFPDLLPGRSGPWRFLFATARSPNPPRPPSP